jgi:hypothetical protein
MMTMTTDLITRLENAEAGQEADALADAWNYCAKIDSPHDRAALAEKAGRFAAMLDAHAWTSAAEMLLGDDPEYDTNTLYHIARASVYSIDGQFHGEHPGGAKFVWAALAAAAVKARG